MEDEEAMVFVTRRVGLSTERPASAFGPPTHFLVWNFQRRGFTLSPPTPSSLEYVSLLIYKSMKSRGSYVTGILLD